MDDNYFKQQARRVRDIAALADPFTKGRLLALAQRYDEGQISPKKAPLPSVSVGARDRTDGSSPD